MPIPKEKRLAYQKSFDAALKKARKLPDDAALALLNDLRAYRMEVVDIIASSQGWNAYYMTQIQGAVDSATKQLTQQMQINMTANINQGWQAGVNLVENPLADISLSVPTIGFSLEDLSLAKDLSAELVTDISTTAQQGIMQQVQLGIMGNKSQTDVIREIGRVIINDTARKKIAGSVFKTASNRAEAIARTETMRVLNAGHLAKGQAISEEFPEMKKFWIADYSPGRNHRITHQQMDALTNPAHGGTPIGMKRLFSVGKGKGRMPHDPRLPAGESVNCLCRMGTTMLEAEDFQELYPDAKTPVVVKPKAKVEPVIKTPKPTFVPAKTVKEAEEWAVNNSLAQKIDYKKLNNVDMANIVNKQLFELQNIYKYKYNKIQAVNRTSGNMKHAAMINTTKISPDGKIERSLLINNAYFSQFKSTKALTKDIQRAHSVKWWVAESVEDLVNHEYGHRLTVDKIYIERQKSRLFDLLNLGIIDTNNLGKYASSSIDESLAEIFARYKKDGFIKDEWKELFNKFSEVKIK